MTRSSRPIDLDAVQADYVDPTTAVIRAALPVLDAELVAVNGVPAHELPLVEDEWVPGQVRVRQSWREDPTVPLFAVGGVLVTGILGTAVYGLVQTIRAVMDYAAQIGIATGGGLLVILLVSLLGTSGAVCVGIHCAGCRG